MKIFNIITVINYNYNKKYLSYVALSKMSMNFMKIPS